MLRASGRDKDSDQMVIPVENRECPPGLQKRETGNFVTVGRILPFAQGKPRIQQPHQPGRSHGQKFVPSNPWVPLRTTQWIPGQYKQLVPNHALSFTVMEWLHISIPYFGTVESVLFGVIFIFSTCGCLGVQMSITRVATGQSLDQY